MDTDQYQDFERKIASASFNEAVLDFHKNAKFFDPSCMCDSEHVEWSVLLPSAHKHIQDCHAALDYLKRSMDRCEECNNIQPKVP